METFQLDGHPMSELCDLLKLKVGQKAEPLQKILLLKASFALMVK